MKNTLRIFTLFVLLIPFLLLAGCAPGSGLGGGAGGGGAGVDAETAATLAASGYLFSIEDPVAQRATARQLQRAAAVVRVVAARDGSTVDLLSHELANALPQRYRPLAPLLVQVASRYLPAKPTEPAKDGVLLQIARGAEESAKAVTVTAKPTASALRMRATLPGLRPWHEWHDFQPERALEKSVLIVKL